MSALRRFVELNRRASFALTPPHVNETNAGAMYNKCAQVLLGRSDVRTVVDVGAGRSWQFSPADKVMFGITLHGIDIAAEEMEGNTALDVATVADVTRSIPVEPGSVDLVMCSSGVEHFSDNAAFLSHVYRALRPGGRVVMQFPSSTAPFAVLNRLLPQRVTAWLLHHLIPGSDGVLGFRAYYDRTRYSAFRDLSRRAGFEIDYHLSGFFSSAYFAFLTPLYLVSHLVDLVRFSLGVRDLASYNLFVLRKPGGDDEPIRWST